MIGKLAVLILILILIPKYLSSRQVPIYEPKLPSIEQIFSDNHNLVSSLPKERVRVIIATGDIIPARSVNSQVFRKKDFNWPYLNTADTLKNADITFANLECPLIEDCPVTDTGMIFCGDSRNVQGLVFAGIDIVSLANNHSANYGQGALDETINLLNSQGISVTGVEGARYITVRGITFAILGYNDIEKIQPGISNVNEVKIKAEIEIAKKSSDVVIVTFHWGAEYQDLPDDRQKYLGHFAIDAGADLIIGNHPHNIQPVEIYKGKLITYAHGNFVFDQEWSLKTKQGVVGKYTFYDNQLVDVEYYPVLIENYGQPKFSSGEEKNKILKKMETLSITGAADRI